MNDRLWYWLIFLFVILVAVFTTVAVNLLADYFRHRAARAFADEEKRRQQLDGIVRRR